MSRSASSIQAQINAIEQYISSGGGIVQSSAVNGLSASSMTMTEATQLLGQLYQELARAHGSSPMFARGRVLGLR